MEHRGLSTQGGQIKLTLIFCLCHICPESIFDHYWHLRTDRGRDGERNEERRGRGVGEWRGGLEERERMRDTDRYCISLFYSAREIVMCVGWFFPLSQGTTWSMQNECKTSKCVSRTESLGGDRKVIGVALFNNTVNLHHVRHQRCEGSSQRQPQDPASWVRRYDRLPRHPVPGVTLVSYEVGFTQLGWHLGNVCFTQLGWHLGNVCFTHLGWHLDNVCFTDLVWHLGNVCFTQLGWHLGNVCFTQLGWHLGNVCFTHLGWHLDNVCFTHLGWHLGNVCFTHLGSHLGNLCFTYLFDS